MLRLVTDDMVDEMEEEPSLDNLLTRFQGTRYECLAFLDSYFSIQRNLVEGARAVSEDMHRRDEVREYDEMLGALDRGVYEVTIIPMGMTSSVEVRPENAYRAMRIRTGLDLFDAIVEDNKPASDDI